MDSNKRPRKAASKKPASRPETSQPEGDQPRSEEQALDRAQVQGPPSRDAVQGGSPLPAEASVGEQTTAPAEPTAKSETATEGTGSEALPRKRRVRRQRRPLYKRKTRSPRNRKAAGVSESSDASTRASIERRKSDQDSDEASGNAPSEGLSDESEPTRPVTSADTAVQPERLESKPDGQAGGLGLTPSESIETTSSDQTSATEESSLRRDFGSADESQVDDQRLPDQPQVVPEGQPADVVVDSDSQARGSDSQRTSTCDESPAKRPSRRPAARRSAAKRSNRDEAATGPKAQEDGNADQPEPESQAAGSETEPSDSIEPAKEDIAQRGTSARPSRSRGRKKSNGKSRGRRGRGSRSGHESQTGSVAPALPPKGTHKVLLMNASDPGEIRVALLENGELAEIFVERQSHRQQTGNIYKGRVVNVEPSLQAAFIDLGSERNGFLHISDCIQPDGGYADILGDKPATPKSRTSKSKTADDVKDSTEATPEVTGPAAKPSDDRNADGSARPARRRRGGRGRSGRARKPSSSAPMVLPANNDDGGVAEDSESADMVLSPEATASTRGNESQHSEPDLVQDQNEEVELTSVSVSDDVAVSVAEEVAEGVADALPAVETELLKPDEELVSEAGTRGRTGAGKQGRRRDTAKRLAIQGVLTKGQDVLVQVAKEGIGQKGPALTTYLSIPGRYLVLMPAVQRLGVSKRIDSEERRRELKEMLSSLNVPDGMGVIVRTAGVDCTREKLQQDMDYLLHRWEVLKKKVRTAHAPALVFQEGDVVTRVFRDVFTDDVAEVVIDDQVVLERAREFLREISPGAEKKLFRYKGQVPLFHRYGVEPQIARVFNRKVPLKSGGSIVIEQTEALVAIDVNTGRFREKANQDETILATNLEAACVIARELRLRDIGGLVMIDLIDMDIEDHRRQVERELRSHLARDKARINMLPISALGVVEMTRQRVRHSLRRTLFKRCPYCEGAGQLKSIETMGLEILRELRAVMSGGGFQRGRVSLHPAVALEILNAMRNKLTKLEEANGRPIEVHGDPTLALSQWRVSVARESLEWVQKREGEVDKYVRNS